MPSQCTYPGDVTEQLLEQAKSGHKWGPDIAGSTILAPSDVGHAIRTNLWDMVRRHLAAGVLPSGAWYDLAEAEYDPESDTTIAKFKPYVDPRQRLRFHGGDDVLEEQPALTGRDEIRAH
jgi:hypothetical protein